MKIFDFETYFFGGSGGRPCTYSLNTYPKPTKRGDVTLKLVAPPPDCNAFTSMAGTTEDPNMSATDQIGSIEVFDSTGNQVYNEAGEGTSHVFNMDNLKKGTYYFRVQTNNGRTFQKRVIKN